MPKKAKKDFKDLPQPKREYTKIYETIYYPDVAKQPKGVKKNKKQVILLATQNTGKTANGIKVERIDGKWTISNA